MIIQRMIELLEIEHECMLRGSHDDCDRNCADCELVQDDSELHEMYTDVIALLKEQEAKRPKRVQLRKVHEDGLTEVWAEYYCSYCNKMIAKKYSPHYPHCMWCGKPVEWEDDM